MLISKVIYLGEYRRQSMDGFTWIGSQQKVIDTRELNITQSHIDKEINASLIVLDPRQYMLWDHPLQGVFNVLNLYIDNP